MIHVEIWSDVVCPFCYIGKRRLEQALEAFPYKDQVTIEWKSFLLNPNQVTDAHKSITEYLAESKGWTLEYAREMNAYVSDMAAGVGLDYQFDRIVVANSLKAHRLLQFAKRKNTGDALKESLLKAYFIEGKNIDDNQVLVDLALANGLEKQEVVEVIADEDSFRKQVFDDVREASALGVRGVPFFVFNRAYGISGAQPLEHFTAVLQKVHDASIQIPATDASDDACRVDGNC